MKPWPPFELDRTPLGEGTWLIQASAGTGKTFTIAGLFLRLILESDFSVRDILVVTFTEAATGELRDRIRRTLAGALRALEGGPVDNPAVSGLLGRAGLEPALARARLERALRAFDEAPIHTIHSFCQRALKDRAFESGELFDIELLTDVSDLHQQVADDFWRGHFYEATTLEAATLLHGKVSPESLAGRLSVHSRHPDLRVISAVNGRALGELRTALDTAFAAARESWRAQRGDILAALDLPRDAVAAGAVTDLPAPAWAKGKHKKPGVLAEELAGLERAFREEGPSPDALGSLAFFTPDALAEDTKAKGKTPAHPFFDHCAAAVTAMEEFLVGVGLEFLACAREEVPRRKQALKVQSFDDLLTRLRGALRGERGTVLAEELRARYRAALIDEFQDTDPVQWEIFQTVFGGTGADQATRLFLIGDPKQAIYGFRGADIFTYLDAARGVGPDRGFTLEKNWRSESPLVAGVNALFRRSSNPFAFDEILFQPVTAAGKADAEPLLEAGRRRAPLRLWFAPRASDRKEISKEHAESLLPSVVASEIVRLLNGGATLGGRRVKPRDVAVLVLENRQASLMQEALRQVGVPSVLHTEASVFAAREARELERVLQALAQPGHERALRAALATDLLGWTGTRLHALGEDSAAWEAQLQQGRELHARWLDRGFMPMFRQWLHLEGVRQRLLGFEDGDRRLTNLLHLAEILHAAAHERRLGPGGLVRWLEEQIAGEERAREEHQLRLERDDDAVQLVTVRKSKGLEYPIVFCPFCWRSSDIRRGNQEQVFFHQRAAGPGDASQFIQDLGSPDYDAHRRLAFHEKLMENLRLLYVALTRARNRCYFVWGAFRGAETSAAAWLLHPPPDVRTPDRTPGAGPRDDDADVQAAMTAHFKALSDAQLEAELADLAAKANAELTPSGAGGAATAAEGALAIERLPETVEGARYQPEAAPAAQLSPRTFERSLVSRWRITSFSGLLADRSDERPDHDAERAPAPAAPEPASGLFAFPRGTQAGTCLHKIFEELDFTRAQDDAVLGPLVTGNLRRHGIDAEAFGDTVVTAVRRTLAVPLDAGQPDFTLERIPPAERINEMEFVLPVRELSPALLRAGLAGAGDDVAARLATLGFRPSEGFLRGFIDLVFRHGERFYIVDWKSNWLGNRAEDYGPEVLRTAMVRQFYVLQYHLYAAALHAHLRLRVPGYRYETHFGGVYYLFLRGLDPARPELGVYRDRPAAELIEQLSQSLFAPPTA